MELLKSVSIVVTVAILVYKVLDLVVAKIGGVNTLLKARDIITDVVQSIEQTVDGSGEVKKQKAVEMIYILFDKFGINLEPEIVDLLIEAAVFAMNLILKNPNY